MSRTRLLTWSGGALLCWSLLSTLASARGESGPWDGYVKPWESHGQDEPDWVSHGKTATSWIHAKEVERLDGDNVSYWVHSHYWITQPNRVTYLLTRWELDCGGRARRTSQSGYDSSGKSVMEIDRLQDWFFIRPNTTEQQVQGIYCEES